MLVIRFGFCMDIVSSCKVVSGGADFSYLRVGQVELTMRMEKLIAALLLKLKAN